MLARRAYVKTWGLRLKYDVLDAYYGGQTHDYLRISGMVDKGAAANCYNRT